MTRNVGIVDRVVRVLLGIILAVFVALNYSDLTIAWVVILGLIALGLIITGLVGYSVVYALFDVDSLDFRFRRHRTA